MPLQHLLEVLGTTKCNEEIIDLWSNGRFCSKTPLRSL